MPSEGETQWSEDDEVAVEPEVPEAFHVHDEDSANWVIRKIIEARAYGNRISGWAEQEKSRAKRDEEFFLFRYGQQLMDWARAQIAAQGGRRKSVNLPAGTVGFRKESLKIIVDDEGAVIAWAQKHKPELVKIIERISKSALNEWVEQTGEFPDVGVHIEPAHERFYVK